MLVDDDGKVRVTPTIPSITANRSFDHENKFCDTKKKRHGKRGKKVIFSSAFSLLSCLNFFNEIENSNITFS